MRSSPANSGINFIRTDLPNKPLLNIQSMDFEASAQTAERRTMLGFGPLQIQTTEHLLAAISGLLIDNIVIEIDNVELPGLDGSAKGFADFIRKAGIVEQAAPKRFVAIEHPIWCKSHDALLVILPDEEFRISYTLSYPVLGAQFFTMAVSEISFESEIAPARTFCSEAEALELLRRGLGKGANYGNTLVMSPGGPVNNTLRFPDELARHKVLDLIGDLCLFGSAIKGHVVAVKSGHKLNMEMVKKLKETYKWESSHTIS
jgi:UDP-3-O-[3-hydroxymyristoyl] N-acetylglucosamine deacetylase/3-hydroxyacyl-[acyl-carrier-protein] dehydratase